jgi:hypothetical protein
MDPELTQSREDIASEPKSGSQNLTGVTGRHRVTSRTSRTSPRPFIPRRPSASEQADKLAEILANADWRPLSNASSWRRRSRWGATCEQADRLGDRPGAELSVGCVLTGRAVSLAARLTCLAGVSRRGAAPRQSGRLAGWSRTVTVPSCAGVCQRVPGWRYGTPPRTRELKSRVGAGDSG